MTTTRTIVWDIRFPRALTAWLVGAALGLVWRGAAGLAAQPAGGFRRAWAFRFCRAWRGDRVCVWLCARSRPLRRWCSRLRAALLVTALGWRRARAGELGADRRRAFELRRRPDRAGAQSRAQSRRAGRSGELDAGLGRGALARTMRRWSAGFLLVGAVLIFVRRARPAGADARRGSRRRDRRRSWPHAHARRARRRGVHRRRDRGGWRDRLCRHRRAASGARAVPGTIRRACCCRARSRAARCLCAPTSPCACCRPTRELKLGVAAALIGGPVFALIAARLASRGGEA